ncbi:hypothetical protein R3P38DRAFT_617022 [Favolaschia claudopus]|uniref:Uncharacterized protein n=1 Tax=Favolaschia claudopus TaxID=2862362 RepID=A0AAW0CAZ6_9AGAR
MSKAADPVENMPFLGYTSQSKAVEDTKAKGSVHETPPRKHGIIPSARSFFSWSFLVALFGWPGLVILGQLLLQTGAWGFFAVLQYQGGVSLPHRVAVSAKNNPHTVEWISTQISTILAFCSTFLFSYGVRQAITLHLRGEGMSLAEFVSSTQIATGGLIFNPRKQLRLTLIAGGVMILTGVQTAGWNALLTPRSIYIDTPLVGHELDLSSHILEQMNNTDAVEYCVEYGTRQAPFMVGQAESGYTAVKGVLGLPATLTVMDKSFNASTGGILPLSLESVDASSWFQNSGELPSTIKPSWELHDGLDTSYRLTQQGFSADVSCSFLNDSNPFIHSLFVGNTSIQGWETPTLGASQINYNTLRANCTNDDDQIHALNFNGAYTYANAPNYLLIVLCPNDHSYTIAMRGNGVYQFMKDTVCTVTPKIISADVSYQSTFVNVTIRSSETAAPVNVHAPPTIAVAETISNMLFWSQAIDANGVGDKIRSLVAAVDPDLGGHSVLNTTEQYLRGVVEYSATVFRACLASNPQFTAALPSSDSMNFPTSGIFQTETVGWEQFPNVTVLQLVPGAIVAVLTTVIVIGAVAHHAADPKGEHFNPSDAMHLMAASSAGGLKQVFDSGVHKDIQAAERVVISLGTSVVGGLSSRDRVSPVATDHPV